MTAPDDQPVLRPCECGGEAFARESYDAAHGNWIAECRRCGARTAPTTNERQAIERWNRRAPVDITDSIRSAFNDAFAERWKQIEAGDRNEIILDRWLDSVDTLRAALASALGQQEGT